MFNWHGAVVASAIVSLPLLYLPSRSGVRQHRSGHGRPLPPDGRANALQTFWHVSLPLARRGIASGLLLAFARGLGEFGLQPSWSWAIVQGHQTLPIYIYDDYVSGELAHAAPAVLMLSFISLVLVLLYNRTIRPSS